MVPALAGLASRRRARRRTNVRPRLRDRRLPVVDHRPGRDGHRPDRRHHHRGMDYWLKDGRWGNGRRNRPQRVLGEHARGYRPVGGAGASSAMWRRAGPGRWAAGGREVRTQQPTWGLPPTTGGRVWPAGSAAPYSPTNGSARSEPTRRCEGPRAQPAARSPATSSSQTPRQRPVVGAAAERTGRRVPRRAASPGEQRTQLHRRLTPCDTGLASRNSDRTIGLHLMVPCPARIALAFTKSRSRETAMLFRARIDQAASLANCPSPRRE